MINLLPPPEKESLRQEANWKLALVLETLFLTFFILLSLVLLSVKFYTSGEFVSQKILEEAKEKKTKEFKAQDFQKKIVSASQNVSKLDSFYQDQAHLSETLEEIAKSLPLRIYLNSFSYQKETGQIGISGFAVNRNSLLEFKENLERNKSFGEIYFPPASWIKSKEIDFSAVLKVKNDSR